MFKDNLDRIKRKENLFLALLTSLLILSIVIMRYFDSFLISDKAQNGIISFELAKNVSKSKSIIEAWDFVAKTAAGLSLGFDFLFLIVYSSFIALLIFKLNKILWKNHWFYKLGRILIWFVFIAAFFDIVENIALIKIILGDLNQNWASIAYYFVMLKFSIIVICIFYIIFNGLLLIIKKAKE
jgi:hypothetical protein